MSIKLYDGLCYVTCNYLHFTFTETLRGISSFATSQAGHFLNLNKSIELLIEATNQIFIEHFFLYVSQ